MTKYFIIYLIFLSPLATLCQTQALEAVYYDNLYKPYKIERKYFYTKDSSIVYTRITDEEIVSIRQKTFYNKDTTIFQEEYSSIKKIKTKADILSESIMFITMSNLGDTTISSYHLYNDSTVVDTIYSGKQSLLSSVIPKETELVTKVLNNVYKLSLDSLTIDETVKTYEVKEQIIKCEIIDRDNLPYHSVHFTKNKMGLTSKSISTYSKERYPGMDSIPRITRTDTIFWDKNKSQVAWIINKINSDRFKTMYFLKGTTLKIFEKDTLFKEVQYLNNTDLFKILLEDNITYHDQLYTIDLLNFDRKKIFSIFLPKEQKKTTFIYKTDNKKRIIEQRQFKNGKPFIKIIYRYL